MRCARALGDGLAFVSLSDDGNVRMIQRGEDFRFALKACQPVVVRRK
jgi:hypothetical protein